jgi:hypothetical protein
MTSHETVCILNTSDQPAEVRITIYLRRPGTGRTLSSSSVPARRTSHIRFNDLTDPAPIPVGYRLCQPSVESNVRIVVQHTRLDSRQAENALFSTMAFPA